MRYSHIFVNGTHILNELTRPKTFNLDDFLNKKGFRVIGKGKFSSVYQNPKFDYILKVFSEKDNGYITFLKSKPNLECFPKIIGKPVKLNDDTYAVRIEKLSQEGTIDKRKLLQILKTIYDNEQKKLSKIIKYKDYKEIYQYIIQDTDLISGVKFLRKMNKNNHDVIIDLHPGNIMFRDNYPVIIDPFFTIGPTLRTDINPKNTYDVFLYVLSSGSKDPELINALLKKPEYAYNYAKDVIKGRWPEAEPVIMTDPRWAYYYAENIIKGRWPEAEPFILKDFESAYFYALDVIKGRWKEAEPFIMKDPQWAYLYARDVIKGRWKEAEPYIMKNSQLVYFYEKYVINGIDKNI